MRIVRNVYRQGTGASEGEGKDASTPFKTTQKKVMGVHMGMVVCVCMCMCMCINLSYMSLSPSLSQVTITLSHVTITLSLSQVTITLSHVTITLSLSQVMGDELRLNLMRQDFLWHTPSAGADTKERIFNALKQVSE